MGHNAYNACPKYPWILKNVRLIKKELMNKKKIIIIKIKNLL